MKNLSTQTALGLWAGIAVFMGITQQSWETFFSLTLILAFFSLPFIGAAAARSQHKGLRLAGYGVTVAFAAGMVVGLLTVAEQMYLTNGRTYPAWLATADIGPYYSDLVSTASVCKNPPAHVFGKDDGLVVIRCGEMNWIGSRTYLAHREIK